MNPIVVGSIAPDFTAKDQYGHPFQLSSLRGKANVLLLFVPASFTPICSSEIPALAAMLDRFLVEAETHPVAIDVDNNPSNLAWSRKCGATRLRILSDFYPHGAISTAYGVLAPDGVSERSTFIVDKRGIVRHATVAGRYGKRSVSDLLSIATALDGRAPVRRAVNPQGLMRLDLPILYVSAGCSHCENVLAFLASSGLSQQIVVRNIASDAQAATDLDAMGASGVPTLKLPNGQLIHGDTPIINALRNINTRAA